MGHPHGKKSWYKFNALLEKSKHTEDTMATQHKQHGSYANAEDYQHANAYAQHAIPRYLTYSLLYMYLKKHLTGNPICENKQKQYSGRGEFKQKYPKD